MRPQIRHAESILTERITRVLWEAGESVAEQARTAFRKVQKDDADDNSDFWDEVDLAALYVLVNSAPDQLAAIMADSGKQALIQLGVEDEENLVNQVNADALAYAQDRAAEMVGKKWVDGELVDNPDAEWVISDSTRDAIQDLVAQVFSGDLKSTQLPSALQDSFAFSRERAQMIARSEVMTANAQGSLAGYKAARSIGVKVKKAWECDAEACDECQDNADAGAIDLDEEFPSGDDAPIAHPNCECVLVPEVEQDEDEDE